MKRIFALIAIIVSVTFAIFAAPLSSRMMFQGDQRTLCLETDGTCYLSHTRYAVKIKGTYDVSGDVVPGCSNVRVVFDFDGDTYTGTLMWPTEEGLKLYFNGSLMDVGR